MLQQILCCAYRFFTVSNVELIKISNEFWSWCLLHPILERFAVANQSDQTDCHFVGEWAGTATSSGMFGWLTKFSTKSSSKWTERLRWWSRYPSWFVVLGDVLNHLGGLLLNLSKICPIVPPSTQKLPTMPVWLVVGASSSNTRALSSSLICVRKTASTISFYFVSVIKCERCASLFKNANASSASSYCSRIMWARTMFRHWSWQKWCWQTRSYSNAQPVTDCIFIAFHLPRTRSETVKHSPSVNVVGWLA